MVGDIACNGSGTFAYKAEAPIVARAAGKISKIALKEGGFASKGQTILTITSDTLSDQVSKAYDSLQDSRLTLEDRYDMLEEYTVKSPISGTIIEKNYKKGDTLSAGKALCTIYDLSYLTMTLNVDELDISKVSVGQKVQITAEAVESKTFEGEVTKVNIKGNTVNGVTSYPVTIRVDNAEDLLPGMNVDANIVIEGKEDVLAVPISALTRGNRVLVQTDPTADGTQMGEDGTPVGFEYTEVETGISDEDYIEIKSGLQEGQTVALVRVFTQNNTLMMPGGQMVAVSGPAGGAPIERQGGAGSGGGMR
jgi:HlyD family secretion protein